MAQPRQRRKTKHRGNAAGIVEARGRTGRKPTTAEKNSGQARGKATQQQQRKNRLDKPPTWKGAFYRSMVAAVIMLLLVLLLLKGTASSIALFPVVLLIYVPISYYTDLWMYRRRQRQKEAAKAGKAEAR